MGRKATNLVYGVSPLNACATASCMQVLGMCEMLACGPEGDHLAPPGAVDPLLQSLGLQTCPHEDHVDLSSLRLADQTSHVLGSPLTPLQHLRTGSCSRKDCIANRCAVQAAAETAATSDWTISGTQCLSGSVLVLLCLQP